MRISDWSSDVCSSDLGSSDATPSAPPRKRTAMRDIAFVAFLFAFIGLGFRKPFLFVLCLCYIDIVAPQRLSYFLINSRSEERRLGKELVSTSELRWSQYH